MNWTRWKFAPSTRAIACASSVFAVPGGPSSRAWPRASAAISIRSTASSWPMTAFATSCRARERSSLNRSAASSSRMKSVLSAIASPVVNLLNRGKIPRFRRERGTARTGSILCAQRLHAWRARRAHPRAARRTRSASPGEGLRPECEPEQEAELRVARAEASGKDRAEEEEEAAERARRREVRQEGSRSACGNDQSYREARRQDDHVREQPVFTSIAASMTSAGQKTAPTSARPWSPKAAKLAATRARLAAVTTTPRFPGRQQHGEPRLLGRGGLGDVLGSMEEKLCSQPMTRIYINSSALA